MLNTSIERRKMPLKKGRDKIGPFFMYGDHGKKYHYISNNKTSRDLAKMKAVKQAVAINYSLRDQGKKMHRII